MARSKINWREVIEEAKRYIRKENEKGRRPTIRAIHYWVSTGVNLYPNLPRYYRYFDRKMVELRLNFPEWFARISDATRPTYGGDIAFIHPKDLLEFKIRDLLELYNSWKLPFWFKQPLLPIIIVEKDALGKTIYDITWDYHVLIFAARGYSAWQALYQLYTQKMKDVPTYVQEIHILHLSDFDPSGQDIKRFHQDAIKKLQKIFGSNVKIEFKHLAVTKEQIEKYRLPHRPEDAQEIEKLKRDPRFKKWIYGLYRVELDAFYGLQGDEFAKIIRNALEECIDHDIRKRVREIENAVRDKLKEVCEKIRIALEPILRELENLVIEEI